MYARSSQVERIVSGSGDEEHTLSVVWVMWVCQAPEVPVERR